MRMRVQYNFIIWITNTIITCHSICSHLYGAEPCTYLPAPPGKTPSCARPGLTYCEYPDHYPGQLIHYLVKKWKFDHTTLLSSESQEDFSSYFYPTLSPVYGPPNYHPPNIISQRGTYPEPIHIPKPQHPFHENGITYAPQNFPPNHNFTGYPGVAGSSKYASQGNRGSYYHPYQQLLEQQPQYGQYNNLWKRALQQNYHRYKRSALKRMPKITDKYSNNTISQRSKRQASPEQRSLCQVRTRYIAPKAALNNKGNWMYVVNMPEVDNSVTQLVKSETCASQICDGICSLPDGYTSRCEQKYVQKRLVALEGSGNQLYTDVFWFPSCCVCTISNS